jgi:hypothetical protein
MSIEIVLPIPTERQPVEVVPPVPLVDRAPGTLTLGVVDNGKHNAGRLLAAYAELLVQRSVVTTTVTVVKTTASRPIDIEAAEDLRDRCQVVLAGVGD